MPLQPTYCLRFTRDLLEEGLKARAAPGTLKNFLHPSKALIEISGSNSGERHPGTGIAKSRRSDSNFVIVEIFRMQGGCTDFISQ